MTGGDGSEWTAVELGYFGQVDIAVLVLPQEAETAGVAADCVEDIEESVGLVVDCMDLE